MEIASGAKNSQSGVMEQERKERKLYFSWSLKFSKQSLTVCQGLQFLGNGKCHISGGMNDKLSSVNLLSALSIILAFYCTWRRR